MKFSISQSELNTMLSMVTKGVSSRSTLPILSGILIKALDGTAIFESTDTNTSIRCMCAALVDEEGETVVPGKLLGDIVKTLPDAAVHLSSTNESITILCDTSSFSLKTFNSNDFPMFPDVEENKKITLPFKDFSSAVKRIVRVVSKDDSRPILTGILVEVTNNVMKMVATDSYRLSIEEKRLELSNEDFSAVVAGSFLNDIASLPADTDTIDLMLSENQIMVKHGNNLFINRRLEGNFPNYNQLIPNGFQTRVVFDTSLIVGSTRRVSLISNNVSPVRIDINKASQTAQISSSTQDLGASQETISAEIEGEDMQIAFNGHYLIDGLSSVSDDKIYLDLQNGSKPGIFKTMDGEFTYLIMPVRLS